MGADIRRGDKPRGRDNDGGATCMDEGIRQEADG